MSNVSAAILALAAVRLAGAGEVSSMFYGKFCSVLSLLSQIGYVRDAEYKFCFSTGLKLEQMADL